MMLKYVIEVLLEWISVADLYTDILVLVQLAHTEHIAWTAITVVTMIAPLFACQIPFITFLKDRVTKAIGKNMSINCKLQTMSYIMITPLMIVYMTLMDLLFMVNQAFLVPIVDLLKFISRGTLDLTCITSTIDGSYEVFFEMQKLDVEGFRRMRTISQLTFETFAQLILQVRMLLYFRGQGGDSQEEQALGVSVDAIAFSIFLAALHAVLEAIYLAMQA